MTITARTLVPGEAAGDTLILDEPLSFWGGVDPLTGTVIDAHHPQHGASLTARVVLMAAGRGSSSSASVLAEAIRLGTAPAGLVLLEADTALALGAVVADELYGISMPVVTISPTEWLEVTDGTPMTVHATIEGARLDAGRG